MYDMRYSPKSFYSRHSSERNYQLSPSRHGGWMFILILILALTYVGLASGIGNWIGGNVVVPMLEQAQEWASGWLGDTQLVPTQQQVDITNLTAYGVQMGVYNTQQNANTQAQWVKSKGGAGYIINDEGFRIMAAVYATEAEATAVCLRLGSEEGISCTVYPVRVNDIAMYMKALNEEADRLKQAVSTLKDVRTKLLLLSIQLEKNEKTKEQAITQLTQCKTDLKTARENITLDNENIDVFKSLCETIEEDIGRTLLGDPQTLNIDLKYLNIQIAERCRTAINGLTD